jgi:hypothetical protein
LPCKKDIKSLYQLPTKSNKNNSFNPLLLLPHMMREDKSGGGERRGSYEKH